MDSENIKYIDLSRETASKKSEYLTNEWTNKMNPVLYIPKGSQIKILNSFINYKGLAGQSIEVLEDENLALQICFYISHSDILIPKPTFKTQDASYNMEERNTGSNTNEIHYSDSGNAYEDESKLRTSYFNAFVEMNRSLLISNPLKTKLQTNFNAYRNTKKTKTNEAKKEATNLWDLFEKGLLGYTEQPLFACQLDSNGFLYPVIQTAYVEIKRGIYSINELSDIITNQINGVNQYISSSSYSDYIDKTQLQEDVEKKNFTGSLNSQFVYKINAMKYSYNYNAQFYMNFRDIILNLSLSELENIFSPAIGNCCLFITAGDFNEMMIDYATTQPASINVKYNITNWRGNNYLASIKNTQYETLTERPTGQLQDAPILIPYSGNNIVENGTTKLPADYFNYNPLRNGLYLGTTDFKFSYDAETNGYSFSFLHQPHRIESLDMIGSKNIQAGNICSYMKNFNLEDILTSKCGLTNNEKAVFLNSILNPKSRIGGVCIYNMDLNLSDENQTNFDGIVISQYLKFKEYFKTEQEAENIWKKSFWYRLGFKYKQFNNNDFFEKSVSFDKTIVTLYGITTNNLVDITISNTLSTLYCPQQSKDTNDKINDGIPYAITEQPQIFNNLLVSKNMFGIGEQTYRSSKYSRYVYTNTYPVLTGSINITARNLPILSNDGYFLITSDIIDGSSDIVKNGQPLSVLGVVPKSTPSNQDFISSFQEIQHTTSQDLYLNSIKIKILNADLTNPVLSDRSSILLQIIYNNANSKFNTNNKNKNKKKKNKRR